jgi:hypothetical protein
LRLLGGSSRLPTDTTKESAIANTGISPLLLIGEIGSSKLRFPGRNNDNRDDSSHILDILQSTFQTLDNRDDCFVAFELAIDFAQGRPDNSHSESQQAGSILGKRRLSKAERKRLVKQKKGHLAYALKQGVASTNDEEDQIDEDEQNGPSANQEQERSSNDSSIMVVFRIQNSLVHKHLVEFRVVTDINRINSYLSLMT